MSISFVIRKSLKYNIIQFLTFVTLWLGAVCCSAVLQYNLCICMQVVRAWQIIIITKLIHAGVSLTTSIWWTWNKWIVSWTPAKNDVITSLKYRWVSTALVPKVRKDDIYVLQPCKTSHGSLVRRQARLTWWWYRRDQQTGAQWEKRV